MKVNALNGYVSKSNPHFPLSGESKEKVITVTYHPNHMDGWAVSKEVHKDTNVNTAFAVEMELECERFF